MKPIRDIHWLNESLCIWQGFNASVKVDCTSTALKSREGWVFVDPIPLHPTALEEILRGQPLAGVILTSGNHERDSPALKAQFGVPIYAPRGSERDVIAADHWYRAGQTLFGDIEAVALTGGGPAETALLHRKTVVVGDALIHLDSLEQLPLKYCEDPELLHESLQFLAEREFDVICFAHGLPIIREGNRRLSEVLGVKS